MNDRMFELYREACEFAYKECEGKNLKNSKAPVWHTLTTKKLAELIIKECMGVTVNYPHPETKLTAAEHIARHFGVEE
jgi:hypothetical protein